MKMIRLQYKQVFDMERVVVMSLFFIIIGRLIRSCVTPQRVHEDLIKISMKTDLANTDSCLKNKTPKSHLFIK